MIRVAKAMNAIVLAVVTVAICAGAQKAWLAGGAGNLVPFLLLSMLLLAPNGMALYSLMSSGHPLIGSAIGINKLFRNTAIFAGIVAVTAHLAFELYSQLPLILIFSATIILPPSINLIVLTKLMPDSKKSRP